MKEVNVIKNERLNMQHVLDLFKRAGDPDPKDVMLAIQTPAGSVEVVSISAVTLKEHRTGERSRDILFEISEADSQMVFASDIQGDSDQVLN